MSCPYGGDRCEDCQISIFLPDADSEKVCQECQTKRFEALEDDDPTPCCYQHVVGAISTSDPCPRIADND